MDEHEIVERCRRGDRAAQRRLYELTSAKVYRLCLKMTGNEEDAFDLAQDTYVRAFEGIDKFDGTARVTTWLFRVAFNESLQLHRKQRREAVRRHLNAKENTTESDDGSADLRLDVESAMGALQMEVRTILLLRYQEGLDYAGIAEALDCAKGTVASRLNRARTQLREKLQESYDCREETGAPDHPKGRSDGSKERRHSGE